MAQSDTAQRFFDSTNTEKDLDRLIAEQVEALYIDYKTKPNHNTPEVDRDLQNVLSKAISGFANADSGIIVMGVDAPQGATPQKKPIQPVAEFEQELNSYLPRATYFAVDGARTKRIALDAGGGGFVLIHVPKSDQAPHCSAKDRRYYKRVGDSFLPMEHYEIADIFGRRHQPKLNVYGKLSGDVNVKGRIDLILGIRNIGRAIAKYPYMSIEQMPDFETAAYGLDGNGNFGLDQVHRGQLIREYRGGADQVIHPGIELDVTRLRGVGSFDGHPTITLTGRIVADSFPVRDWTIVISVERIAHAIGNPRTPSVVEGVLS
jgi:schlafen family protein